MLFLHKHHLYLHQRYSDQRRGHRSNCEIPTTNQSFIQRGGAAQWEHRLRKKWVSATSSQFSAPTEI